MTCADAMMAERAAWDALMSASAAAVELHLAAVEIPPGDLREQADWTAKLAVVREGICRDRWNQASEALAEAAANRSARSSAMTPTAWIEYVPMRVAASHIDS